ncbi:hypothetical protein BDW75DRAFT_245438 [Aspergillus navahoensis]
MVLSVAANCNNTIVVINTVGPRLMESWIEKDNITAVLYGGLLGQESGFAIPDNGSDYPALICETTECDFTEGVYIDYRWFEERNITPRYEFGHDLSYPEFKISGRLPRWRSKGALIGSPFSSVFQLY